MSLPRFGVTRPVPVRLLMFAVLIGGVFVAFNMRREFFPETNPDSIRITLPYPGATPQEIEESMARKVEDAIADLDEIDEIQTNLSENVGVITVKLKSGVDIAKGHDEIQRAIDALSDLPEDAEEIRVTDFEPQVPVIMLTLHGDSDEVVLKRNIREIADDLRGLPGMGDVVVGGVRNYEVRIDVDESALLEHGLSIPMVSDAIAAWTADVPGGTSRTATGNISVRALGVQERADEIRNIVIAATPNGSALRVGEIATITHDFVDDQIARRFNGQPAVSLTVFKTGAQDAIEIAEMVRSYAAGRQGKPLELGWRERLLGSVKPGAWALGAKRVEKLPGEISLHSDLARFIEGRLQLLTDNAIQGAALIFLTILIVLNVRTAWWVVMGLITALCGTLILMYAFDVTLNLLTMFGLLITLGMLEDDAIVVSENITAMDQKGNPPLVAAIKGAEQVFWPVIGTVLTTVVAFVPLMLVKGRIGDLLGALPWIVVFSLLVSVIETMTILPSHMAHSLEHRGKRQPGPIARGLRRIEAWRDRVILGGIIERYAKSLTLMLEYRYISTAIALAVLIISLGMIAGGRLDFTFLDSSDSETIVVDVRLPIGAPLAQTEAVMQRIEQAATAQPEVKTISATLGQQMNVDLGVPDANATHVGQMFIELTAVEQRDRESAQVIDAIRTSMGNIDEAESVRFSEIGGAGGGPDITIRLAGTDDDQVVACVARIKLLLADFDGVHDISDDNFDSQRELQIVLRPGAATLGFTVQDVARQVRGALYGLEPHVFSADREDIKIRVRLDEESRRSLATIESLWIISPRGDRVPLGEVADLIDGRGYSSIRRIDRERAITVSADTAQSTNPELIVQELMPHLNELRAQHPQVTIEFAGRQRDLADAFSTLPIAFIAALVLIYLILATLFSSYVQPLVVMIAIPFSIIGVVWGHMLLGYPLTFLSLIGFVALTGVVVNNSLILIDFYNTKRAAGITLREALVSAGRDRLRPIVLTSVTTFFGLAPLVFEQSFQAKFLIPMAISISFGLISSTILVLTVLPCFMVIVDDVKAVMHYLWHGLPRQEQVTLVESLPAESE